MPTRKYRRSLKTWRLQLGLRQDQAAVLLSMTQGHYSKVERAIQTPRPHRAKAISEKTGVPLEIILGIA